MEFVGEFETHITVHLNEIEEIELLQEWGVEHGLKCLHIILDRGLTVSQPMLSRNGCGDFANELRIATDLCQSLKAESFSVVRIKIEAAPWNQGVPQSNIDALSHPACRYFEHHIKLLLNISTDIVYLTQIAEQHSAHCSRNILRNRNDDYHERFITQRCIGIGRIEAQQRLQKLLDIIDTLNYLVIGVTEEFVVYDSNLEIDKGWIQSKI